MTYAMHIIAGAIGLGSGFLALYSTKGAPLHRRSGMVFVYSMLAMTTFGFAMAIARNKAPGINVPAAVLTSYLIVTALATVRPPTAAARAIGVVGALIALGVGLVTLTFGYEAVLAGGKRHGIPAFPFFLFGVVGLLGFAGDVRVLRTPPLRGAPRIARHLWRMSFALWIAALSFFIGQAKVFPKPIRIPALLGIPVVAVLVTMFYWLWRVRIRRSLRGMMGLGVVEPA